MLTVEEHLGITAFDNLRDEWPVLHRGAGASPFLSWEWLSTWHKWFGRRITPRLICVRDDGRLVALLALGQERRKAILPCLSTRRLTLLGDSVGGADYLGMISLPTYRAAAATSIFEHLARNGDFDFLELDSLAQDSPSIFAAKQIFESNSIYRYQVLPRFVCPLIDLDQESEMILNPSKRAEKFRRQWRHLSGNNGIDYRVITRLEEATEAFERFLPLHESRWADEGGSDLTGDTRLASFHREVVVALARAGLLRFEELWAEGQCRASIYGLENGRSFYLYNSGYDQSWSKFSPGRFLIGLSIEQALNRGIKHYDFLRGKESYKYHWANKERETVALLAWRHSLATRTILAARSLSRALKAGLKRVLPVHLWLAMRRWHHSHRHSHALSPGV